MDSDLDQLEARMQEKFTVVRAAMLHGKLPPVELEEALSALMDVQESALRAQRNAGDGKFLTIEDWTPWKRTLIWLAATGILVGVNVAATVLLR